MSVKYKTEALVFKKEDWSEADRIFSIFTYDFGKVQVIGKAIRKITSKLRGGLEIFSFCEIEFIQGKNRKILTDAVFLDKFKSIPQIPEKLAVAYKISDILDNFIKGEENDEKIWGLLVDIFEKLDTHFSKNFNYQLIYFYFFWNFISTLGHCPELSKCAACQQKLNPNDLYFSNKEGGVICRNCYIANTNAIKITSDAVKILRLILQKDWEVLLKLKIETSCQKDLEEILKNYYDYFI
ncbi:MAG: repair protein RecO protein [Parcubacteria group bacterium GW2011_GWA1_33_6]|uniref:DNA repair protein RecO n=1 Tax=Candidatus Staskawiczbacteria bacterium RIFCSPHIGHO2_02_FULL_33_16 TaxID=1802204 RepID=A0A1G2HV42_9BACT|nr:MAG: repair protein RecO protein [Parcubacteria group bacterium GW2011_GWA2_33_14]KKP54248.1 MAG: repair protein RecO protein [Parcubacteria group bacterium GW2011_GWA1_33_6]OGZ66070.1 MAG: DNA repair protein RecO [Candidatus Staskawiczbacteria bacterium RIFCSPHIGHO2_02_FULL_33_16]OGZ70821.1 MAG: DNA repair protein RecO [Candidatus Staskawiczbacteria bacterium RIFCSPLOWO2_01_FULL_33_13]